MNEQFAAERCNTVQALALRPIITGCEPPPLCDPPAPTLSFRTGERSLRWRAQKSRFLSPRLLCTAPSASQRKQKPSKTISYPHLSADWRASAERGGREGGGEKTRKTFHLSIVTPGEK